MEMNEGQRVRDEGEDGGRRVKKKKEERGEGGGRRRRIWRGRRQKGRMREKTNVTEEV